MYKKLPPYLQNFEFCYIFINNTYTTFPYICFLQYGYIYHYQNMYNRTSTSNKDYFSEYTRKDPK